MTPGLNWKQWSAIPWKIKGRDFDGVDCWGLVHLFYWHELGIWLEPYLGQGFDGDWAATRPVGEDIKQNEIDTQFVKVTKPQPTDIVLLLILGAPVHVGIYQRPGHFLHAEQLQGTVIVNEWKWRNRIEGYYRHQSLLDQ